MNNRDLKFDFEKWLKGNGLAFYSLDNKYFIDGEHGLWKVIVDVPRKGRSISFRAKLMNVIWMFDGKINKGSLLIERENNNVAQFKMLASHVKETLNLTLLVVNSNGKIKEYL